MSNHVLSMTGFSSATISIPIVFAQQQSEQEATRTISLQVTLTLKSLNSRFFEANCKLPYALTHLETDLIKEFKRKLHRGNIYFTLHMTNPHALTCVVEPSMPAIAGYLSAIKHIQHDFNIGGQVTIAEILDLPHIFQTQEQQFDQRTTDLLLQAASNLTEQLYNVRAQEGASLAEDINGRIAKIRQYLEQLVPKAEQVMEQRKKQLLDNLKQLTVCPDTNPQADAQKLAVYAQIEKLDIHEEIVRFKMHLENLANTLKSSEVEKGKKLDFILQELFREANTTASKCPDATVSSLVINIKVELEKAREQVQNIV